ncbi:MAG TPA: alpha/beta hydrolase [Acidimicrobiia bacterium]|nr:alpha/beta hydrolase [Acidimicrobiia bacterium]
MTYVLIHGGGSTARFWDRLLAYLDGPALAIDLPGRNDKPGDLATLTVDDEVASVLADIEKAAVADPIVLVAHSSGGLVVPGVVAGLGSRVTHIVLSAAAVPPEGGCGLDCMQPRHAEGLRSALGQVGRDGTAITLPGRPADPEQFRTTYGGAPLDDETLAFVIDPARCVPDTVHHYLQPVCWSRAADVPITYVVNERDRPIPTALQDEMIARLPTPPAVIRLDGGHIPAVTTPAVFADMLRSVDRSLS